MNLIEPAHYRILVIDDTESIHSDFRKTLTMPEHDATLDAQEAELFGTAPTPTRLGPFLIDSALQGEEGFAKVRQAVQEGRPYALAFVDMRMPPGWDGVQTIEHLWRIDPNLQVVICTAYSDYSWDHIVQRLGVSDRLLILKKPFDNAEVSQLAVALTQKWLLSQKATMKVEELERLVEKRTTELRHAALHDKLTDLPNRAQLLQKLGELLRTEGDRRPGFAVLFMDFDRFKIINDSLGHEVGDLLLMEIAGRLRRAMESWNATATDTAWTAGRLGGDEFLILLEGYESLSEVKRLAENLLEQLRQPYFLRGHEVYTSASIGITTSQIAYTQPEDILRDADAAMYRAKSTGRDRFMVFDQSMHQQTMQRLQMEISLRKAVERDEFILHYQPIVEIESGRIAGVEALVRWMPPGREPVAPDKFITVAEETGLIVPIGQWVLQQAVAQLARWQHEFPGAQPLYMSINLSKQQLLDSSLVRQVRQMLAATGVDPGAVHLEVTESTVMEKPEIVTGIMRNLKSLGVRLSMDDFGTGHSSLNCLHMFPIDVLKIDRAFILNLEQNIEYSAVVQAIITLAANLHMRVTAEGIETLEQLAQIQALDCPYGQGYLFARPLPAEELADLLALGRPLGRA